MIKNLLFHIQIYLTFMVKKMEQAYLKSRFYNIKIIL